MVTSRKATQQPTHPAPVMPGGLMEALVRLVERHGFAAAEVAAIAALIVTRWSKSDDATGAAEMLSRTLAQFAGDPRVDEVIELGDEVFSTAAGRARHRVIPVTIEDVYDLFDISERDAPPPASTIIGYLLIHGTLAVFRVAYSGSVAGAIYDRREEPTNLYTESLIQILKLIRYHQEQQGASWLDVELSTRFSDDFTRTSRFALEAQRMLRWFGELHIEWWLGAEAQPRDKFAALINQLRAADAESKGADSTVRTSEGIVDHLVHPERDPRAESKLLPWRRHAVDPDGGIDPRKRTGGDGSGKGCLLAEFAVEVVPAVRAWMMAMTQGASHDELAAICVAYGVPTVRHSKRNGPRSTTFDQLPWSSARRRAPRLMFLSDAPKRLDALPDPGAPERAVVERRNAARVAYLEAARTGVERVTYRVPKTAAPGLRTFGKSQQLVVRDRQADRGLVVIHRDVGFPPAHTLKTEPRTIRVPRGTFLTPSKVLGLQETPVSTTHAEVLIDVDVLDQPLLRDGQPVAWERLGLDEAVFEAIYERMRSPRNEGGKEGEIGPVATVLPQIRNRLVMHEGTEVEVFVRPSGAWDSRRREVWCRPATITGGWGVERRRNVTIDGHKRLHIDGEDRTDWWVATLQEGLLLRSVVAELTGQVDAAFAHDVELSMVMPVDPDGVVLNEQHRKLKQSRDDAEAAASELRLDAEGQDLLVGRALARAEEARVAGNSDGVVSHNAAAERAEERAASLRADEQDQLALIAKIDPELTDLATQETRHRRAALDQRWLSHLVALLRKLVGETHGPGPGVVAGELLIVRAILDRMLKDWTVHPPVDGFVHWSCTATIDTIAGERVSLPLVGRVLNTANGFGSGDPETAEALERVLEGQALDVVLGDAQRATSRASLVRRLYPALDKLGIVATKKAALLDHPFVVARQAVHAPVTGQRPDPVPWDDDWERWMHDTYTTGAWARAACPTDVTDVQLVAACLAQHPVTGVEVGHLAAKSGATVERIRQMINPPAGGTGHIRRPAYFRWVSEGIVGLHPCPHTQLCPAESAWCSVVVLLPETNPQPGEAGGVLCDTCLRLPVAQVTVAFPDDYRTLVTGEMGTSGSIRERQLTRLAHPPAVKKVNAPAGTTLPELQGESGLPRHVLKLLLEQAGVLKLRRRRAGNKMAAVYGTAPARAAIVAANLDPLAYRSDALGVSAAAQHAGITVEELVAATEANQLCAHVNGNGHRKWLPEDLHGWIAIRRAA